MQVGCVEHARERLNNVVCLHRFNTPNTWRETLNPQTLSGGFFYVLATQLLTHAKKCLKRAFSAIGGHFFAQSADGFV